MNISGSVRTLICWMCLKVEEMLKDNGLYNKNFYEFILFLFNHESNFPY
jgi:hypothetical protein